MPPMYRPASREGSERVTVRLAAAAAAAAGLCCAARQVIAWMARRRCAPGATSTALTGCGMAAQHCPNLRGGS